MRFAFPALAIIVFMITCTVLFNTFSNADPRDTTNRFLRDIRNGDYKKTVKNFGGNACRCPAKGGWVSYLVYASGEEPNLAFIMGKQFDFGNSKFQRIPTQSDAKSIVPWEKPEDVVVDVPIDFSKGYKPLFLPLPMAYGQSMTEAELNEFLTDPDKDAWKGLTLRMRPSLSPGLMERPKESHEIEYRPTEKLRGVDATESGSYGVTVDNGASSESETEKILLEALGKDALVYLHPKDPGPVKTPAGLTVSMEQVESKLPRVKSVLLRLHVVRRGQLKDWTVYHIGVTEPVLEVGDKQIALKNYLPPAVARRHANLPPETDAQEQSESQIPESQAPESQAPEQQSVQQK